MLNNDSFIIYILAPIVASLLTWIFARKKQNADASVSISEATQTSVGSLILVMDKLKNKIEESTEEIELLKIRMEELIIENELLRMELEELKEQNRRLLEENSKLRIDIHRLTDQLKSMK
jgi:FtsZ-binding cell division protein ZapB